MAARSCLLANPSPLLPTRPGRIRMPMAHHSRDCGVSGYISGKGTPRPASPSAQWRADTYAGAEGPPCTPQSWLAGCPQKGWPGTPPLQTQCPCLEWDRVPGYEKGVNQGVGVPGALIPLFGRLWGEKPDLRPFSPASPAPTHRHHTKGHV